MNAEEMDRDRVLAQLAAHRRDGAVMVALRDRMDQSASMTDVQRIDLANDLREFTDAVIDGETDPDDV